MEINEWYQQLNHFIQGLPHPLRSGDQLSDLEKICTTERSKGIVSKLYRILMKMGEPGIPPFIGKWERELGTKRDRTTIERMLTLTHSSAVDSRTAEMCFKCIAGWYMTPDKLKQFKEGQTGNCWRGCSTLGNMAHLWWGCPKIKEYWEKILGCVEEITKKKIKMDPWVVLFHGGEEGIKRYRESLIPHLLNAAKRLIPRRWQDPDPPLIWEWIDAVEETYKMEELKEGLEGNNILLSTKWENWRIFKKTWSYAQKLREEF